MNVGRLVEKLKRFGDRFYWSSSRRGRDPTEPSSSGEICYAPPNQTYRLVVARRFQDHELSRDEINELKRRCRELPGFVVMCSYVDELIKAQENVTGIYLAYRYELCDRNLYVRSASKANADYSSETTGFNYRNDGCHFMFKYFNLDELVQNDENAHATIGSIFDSLKLWSGYGYSWPALREESHSGYCKSNRLLR